jgi:hypothetical protein
MNLINDQGDSDALGTYKREFGDWCGSQPEVNLREKFAATFEFLDVGDTWQLGDRYGVGFCFIIGTPSTGDKPGDKVRREQMSYLPRRLKRAAAEPESRLP